MPRKGLISAGPGSGPSSAYLHKAQLNSAATAAKEALSAELNLKEGIYVAPQQRKTQQDQTNYKVETVANEEPQATSSVTITSQAGFQQLASSKHTAIKSLEFRCGSLTIQTMRQLVKISWPLLRSLNLSSSNLNTDGMQHLVKGLWPDLMHLNLSNNSLDEEAMFLMSDLGANWSNLETLDLRSVPALSTFK